MQRSQQICSQVRRLQAVSVPRIETRRRYFSSKHRRLLSYEMSSPLITISADANIREAMSIMVEKEIRRLFIVENGKILGRVTQTRLFESSLQVMLNLSNLTVQL